MSKSFNFKNGPVDLLNMEISSEHLCLVPISLIYEQEIFSSFTAEITRYMFPQSARNINETRAFITESIESMRRGYNVQLVILARDTRSFLGCCGLYGFENPGIPEFGIWLKKDAHGFGYGKEAIQMLYDWARKNLRADYYIYPVDRNNIASKKIPESLNGCVITEYIHKGMAGNTLDTVVYKIPA